MSYQSFEYSNGDGQFEAERDRSLSGVVSWVILKSLKFALLLVVTGLVLSVVKLSIPSLELDMAPAAVAHFARAALHAYAPG